MKEKERQQKILDILSEVYADTESALEYDSVFQLLVAVMLSAQTNDNQVNRITQGLFTAYPDAFALSKLEPEELEPLISSCGLYKNKAKNIIATSRILCEQYQGEVPQEKSALTALPGVGGKTANVVLAVGFGIPALAVDTHVFRVSHRLNFSQGKTPEQTEADLCAIIPKVDWAKAHHWLIWHGRRLCSARQPRCGDCPLSEFCPSAQK